MEKIEEIISLNMNQDRANWQLQEKINELIKNQNEIIDYIEGQKVLKLNKSIKDLMAGDFEDETFDIDEEKPMSKLEEARKSVEETLSIYSQISETLDINEAIIKIGCISDYFESAIEEIIKEKDEEIKQLKYKDKVSYKLLSKIWDYVDKNYSDIETGTGKIEYLLKRHEQLKQNKISQESIEFIKYIKMSIERHEAYKPAIKNDAIMWLDKLLNELGVK